jgi:hypothetical protein
MAARTRFVSKVLSHGQVVHESVESDGKTSFNALAHADYTDKQGRRRFVTLRRVEFDHHTNTATLFYGPDPDIDQPGF